MVCGLRKGLSLREPEGFPGALDLVQGIAPDLINPLSQSKQFARKVLQEQATQLEIRARA